MGAPGADDAAGPLSEEEAPVANPASAVSAAPSAKKPFPWTRTLAPIAVCVIVALLPRPAGLTPDAWRYFALFVAVVIGLILEPLPAAAIGLIGVCIAAVAGLVETEPAKAVAWALSGFSNSTIWLIFAAYMFAEGYSKTGLGRRIALLLIRWLGARTLGLGYAAALADLALAPFTPSNTARSGGTVYPIIKNVPPLYGSLPGETARKMGAYLLYTALASTCVTSSMFMTGLAPNVLALSLIEKTVNVNIAWTEWFVGFLPVGVILFLAVPWLLYLIYPPEVKRAPEAPVWASEELGKLGPLTRKEITLLLVVAAALILWIVGTKYVDTTMTALLAVVAMVLLGLLSWDDVIANRQAWNVLVWFATLVTLAGGLTRVKFVEWLGKTLGPVFEGMGTVTGVVILTGLFFLLHYLFASGTAHATALLPVFLTVAVTIPGLSPKTWALLLAYTLGIMGILTPFATGPSPIYFGSGNIASKDFWTYGLILGVIFFGVFLVVGVPWILFLKP